MEALPSTPELDSLPSIKKLDEATVNKIGNLQIEASLDI
jgi:hypothetical protein